jgi:hypothetical protein
MAAPRPMRPAPPFARVAFTGGSRGCVAGGPVVATWPRWRRSRLAAIRQVMAVPTHVAQFRPCGGHG